MSTLKLTAVGILGSIIILAALSFTNQAKAIGPVHVPDRYIGSRPGDLFVPDGIIGRAELGLSYLGASPAPPYVPNAYFTVNLSARNYGRIAANVRVIQIGRTSAGAVGVTATSRPFQVLPGQTVNTQIRLRAIHRNISGNFYKSTLHLQNVNETDTGEPNLFSSAWRDSNSADNSIRVNVSIRASVYTVFAKLRSITFNGNCRGEDHRVSYVMPIRASTLPFDSHPSGPSHTTQTADYPISGELTGQLTPNQNIMVNKTFRFRHVHRGHPLLLSVEMTRFDKEELRPRSVAALGTATTNVRPRAWEYGFSYTSHSDESASTARYACRQRGIFSANWQVWSVPEY